MSWIVTECRDPETGRTAWVARCLEPGCSWADREIRSDMVEAAGFEHTLTAHQRNLPSPEGTEAVDDGR